MYFHYLFRISSRIFSGSLFLFWALLAGDAAADFDQIVTTSSPIYSVTQRLISSRDAVTLLPMPGVNVAEYSPDSNSLRMLQQADFLIANGSELERWLKFTNLSRRKLIVLEDAFAKEDLIATAEFSHSHGPGGEHTHGGVNPYFLMLPENLGKTIDFLKNRMNHSNTKVFSKQAEEDLRNQISQLDSDLKLLSAALRGRIVLSGESFAYLDRHYKWNAVNCSIHFDEMPEEWQTGELRGKLTGKQMRFILFPAEPLPELKSLMEDKFKFEVLVLPDCMSSSCDKDFLDGYSKSLLQILNQPGFSEKS